MAMRRVILRPISGVRADVGDVVDVSGWRNAAALERQKYLGRLVVPDDDEKEES